ncbi:MAG: Aldehyde dehydrogenase [Bacteriovoracaceae bacterium]|nr:Aldehyde dehydrogenase [Bacteriovoracaceae bacterium]
MQLKQKEFQDSSQTLRTPYDGFDLLSLDGAWRAGRAGNRMNDINPYTGEVLVEIPLCSKEDVDDAYYAAERAQNQWANALPQERRDVLERAAQIVIDRKEEIIDWLIKESGSTRIKANWEWELVHFGMLEAASFPFHVKSQILPSSIPGKESRVYRQPVGVVGVISPWNFPLYLSNRSVAPALALGDAVVLKPASDTPICGGLLLAKIFEEAGLPSGVLNVVVGSGGEIGDAFVDHPVPRVLSFTGSTPVGRHIGEHSGRMVKRVCLELGGNNPFVVLKDADLDRAVEAAVHGKFMHQGQVCMAINRILVDESKYDDFLELFTKAVKKLKVGNPHDSETLIGPLINRSQLEKIEKLVDATLARGASAVLRGQAKGLVLPPIILADVTNDMPAAKEEIFGPVASMLRFDGEEEALRIANDTEYGLSSAVFTKDIERGVRFAKKIQAGMTHVNDSPVQDEPHTAFGGEKASGIGRFGGEWAIREFTTDHWISVQEKPRFYF